MAAVSFTVFGAQGFVGSHLVQRLRADGACVRAIGRAGPEADRSALFEAELGHLMYCAGVTSDFRARPFETMEAHVGMLAVMLERAKFDSLTYFSSTRVYARSSIANEDAILAVCPTDAGDLYNLSKLAGEGLCLASGRPTRVVRLSNVYGDDSGSGNFISEVVRQAALEMKVVLHSSPSSSRDFVSIDDVTAWLAPIALNGSERIYNLARGENTSNHALASRLQSLGVAVEFKPEAASSLFPPIDTSRVSKEFFAARRNLLNDLPALLSAFKAAAGRSPYGTSSISAT